MHEKLVEEAKEAIQNLFGDTSVPRSTTRERLKDLIDEIKMLLETLD